MTPDRQQSLELLKGSHFLSGRLKFSSLQFTGIIYQPTLSPLTTLPRMLCLYSTTNSMGLWTDGNTSTSLYVRFLIRKLGNHWGAHIWSKIEGWRENSVWDASGGNNGQANQPGCIPDLHWKASLQLFLVSCLKQGTCQVKLKSSARTVLSPKCREVGLSKLIAGKNFLHM